MRYCLLIMGMLAILLADFVSADSPPFSIVTITGVVSSKYNKVCLFESGGAKEPFKTEYISDYDGEYRIDVEIPSDMKEKDDYRYTDMRFWGDKNDNGVRDKGEPISECHFIMWVPSAKIVYMQIYKGARHRFESEVLTYNYNK